MAEITAKIVMELRGRTGARHDGLQEGAGRRATATWKRPSTICAKRAWPPPPRSRAASPPRASWAAYICEGVRHRRPGRGQLRDRLRGQDRQVQGTGQRRGQADRQVRIPPTWTRCSSQPFFKDESDAPSSEMVTAATAEIGEKISIRRFVRYAPRAASWTATSTWAARSACWCRPRAKSTTTSRKSSTTSPCRSPPLPRSLPSM